MEVCGHLETTPPRYQWWVGIVQSAWRLATGWTVRGSNPSEGNVFRARPDWPWGLPSHLYDGYRVFPVALTIHSHIAPRLNKE
jgi:hypothetical protein